MMMKTVVQAVLITMLGGLGLSGCDASEAPENAATERVESVASPVEPPDAPPPATTPSSASDQPEISSADEIAADEFRQALDAIVRDPDAYARARKLAALLPDSGPEGVPAVQKALGDHTFDLGAAERELLVRYWATHQPEIATTWAVTSTPVHRIPAVACALSIWAETDPLTAAATAEAWMEQDPALGKFLPIALVRGWYANGDSPELQQYIQGLGKSFNRQRALATYIRVMIQLDGAEKAERWALSLPDDDRSYKLAAFRQVASVLPMFDHEAGIRWCEVHCEGPYGKDLRGFIARRWALEDPRDALVWLLAAPESTDTNVAVRATYSLWGRRDREAALGWMADQIAEERLSPRLRPAFSLYALFVAEDSPSDAIEFAMRIEDERDRANVLILIVREWRKTDPEASEAWVQQSPLSEADRERARRDSKTLEPQAPAESEESE